MYITESWYVHVRVRARVRVCMCVCARVCACVPMYACVCVVVRVYSVHAESRQHTSAIITLEVAQQHYCSGWQQRRLGS